jgi:two-component system, response regulator PdtaR
MNELRECVLVVDDEVLIADLWCKVLGDIGLEVCGTAATGATAIAMAQKYRPKVVLMDVRLKGRMDGIDAAHAIHDLVGSGFIFITGSKDPSITMRIQLDHPATVLFKPVSERKLQIAVKAAMDLQAADDAHGLLGRRRGNPPRVPWCIGTFPTP